MLTLYDFWRSTAAYRVRIALGLKAIPYQSIKINLRMGEHKLPMYRAVNPQGFIPFLIDGDVRLGQSLAIIAYLDGRFPDHPLAPANLVQRAQMQAAALTIACDIHPLNNLRVLKYLENEAALAPTAVTAWARHWIGEGFGALEPIAANRGTACFFDEEPGLADICLVAQMYNARRVETDLSPYPALVALTETLSALPAVDAARPEAQSDAVLV